MSRLGVDDLVAIAAKDPRVRVTSTYRDPQHNAKVGGVPNSQHIDRTAIDFVAPGMSLKEAQAMFPGETVMYHNAGSGYHFHVQGNGVSKPDDDLAAMGFGQPQSVDTPDLSAAGLAAVPETELRRARADLDNIASVQPAPSKMAQDVNGIIDKGLKAGSSRADIRKQVYDYQAANGIDPTKTSGVDDYIKWRQSGHTGAAPVLNQVNVKPLNRLQRVAAGLKQGVEDVQATFDPAAKWLDNNLINTGTAAPAADLHARDRALFNATMSDDTLGNLGRIGGNVAASAPLLMIGNALASGATRGLIDIAPKVAPTADFLAGNMGGNLLVRGASAATQGAIQGTEGAALTSGGSDTPLIDQLKTGAVVGAGLVPAMGIIKPVAKYAANKIINAFVPPADAAQRIVSQRIAQDASGGSNLLEALTANAGSGKPLTPMDLGGQNLLSLAGRIARAPGEGREIIAKTLNDRDMEAGTRIASDIRQAINGAGSAYDTTQQLMQQRAQAAQPLYEKAFSGGSVAPLESQFQKAFEVSSKAVSDAAKEVASANAQSLLGSAGSSRAGNNVYANSAASRAASESEQALSAAESKLAAAKAAHEGNLERLRQAQADGSANAPGAVWSPRIQQFLDDPIAKAGLAKGIEVQRLESLAQGRAFNPTEYAVTGTDEAGNPIVASVPNMRTLDAVKKGFDAILSEYPRSPSGKLQLDQRGKAIDQVRGAFLKEIDAINPDYAAARASWSGPSGSMDALAQGRNILNMRPEASRDYIANLSEGDKEFFKQGAADALLEKVAKTGAGGDETKRLIGNSYVQQQLRPLFSSQAAFEKFIGNIQTEARMFATRHEILGNSKSAARLAEDAAPISQAAVNGARIAVAGATGNIPAMIRHGAGSFMDFVQRERPSVNTEIANLLVGDPANVAENVNKLISRGGSLDGNAGRNFRSYYIPPAAIAVNRLLNATSPSKPLE